MPISSTPSAEEQDSLTEGSQDEAEEQPQDGSSTEDGSTPNDDLGRLQRELSRARQQAAASRAELKAYREAEKALKAEHSTTQEQTSNRLVELETENKRLAPKLSDARLTVNVMGHASRLGIVDPDAAVKLLDRDALEVDDEGNVLNVEDALRASSRSDRIWHRSRSRSRLPA